MSKQKIVLFLSVIFTVLVMNSCRFFGKQNTLNEILEQAGANQDELQKVITHYRKNPKDSLKLKAACFLIENMPGHFSYDSTDLYHYRPVIDTINSMRSKGLSLGIIKGRVNPLLDSLIAIYPLSNVYSRRESDLSSIKSDMLIDNIEQAFESYNSNPFKSSILFEDFLEYVLPYRIQNGYCLEDWRTYFRSTYYFRNKNDFLSVNQLCDSLLCNFKNVKIGWEVANQFPYIKLDDYLKSQMTHCPQKCWFNCLLLRSFGIPVTIDFVPASRVHESGHEWNSLKLKEGFYPFEPFWKGRIEYLKSYYAREKIHPTLGPIQFPKIYRKTFKANISELLKHSISSGEEIPPFFQNPFLKDVTDEYFKTFPIETFIIKNIDKVDYAYACIMGSNQTWIPVDFGKTKRGKITFSSLGSENVYLPSFYISGNMVPAAYPILLSADGKRSVLCPDTFRTQKINISYVAYPRPELKEYKEAFIGATVEGSNDKNFEKSEILYQVNELCEPRTYHIPIYSRYKYRYFRFTMPKAKSKLNEIKFFNRKNGIENELKGELISSNPKDNSLFHNIIDENLITGVVFTSLSETNKLFDKIWIGCDFKYPVSVSAFEFYFVFDANIRKEGIYELLYWDFGWKSLGTKKSGYSSISFDNVPKNALLMIKIHDTNKYSRIFTYSDGTQYWW